IGNGAAAEGRAGRIQQGTQEGRGPASALSSARRSAHAGATGKVEPGIKAGFALIKRNSQKQEYLAVRRGIN
ncbi:MAG: hypothetical protein ABLT11_03030, partial [Candidatus Acidiferrum sp.]